jgi:serine protease SohB
MNIDFAGILSIVANLIIVFLGVLALLILMVLMIAIGWGLGRAKAKGGKLAKDETGIVHYGDQTKYELKESISSLRADEQKKGWFGGGKEAEEKPFNEIELAKRPIAVLTFEGDLRATKRKLFASMVDEVVVNRDCFSEIVVAANSPGGAIAEYGLVYAEMERLRALGLPLTVCIDTYGASGGYLLSLPANKIVAAPFAIVGSVGVVAYSPNIHKLLKKHDIEPRLFTAGEYKRTVTFIGEDDEDAKRHFQQELETIHALFLSAVEKYRPNANMEQVRTGDHWTAEASVAMNLGLVDEIATSRDYLLRLNQDRELVMLSQKKPMLPESFGRAAASAVSSLVEYYRF